MNPLNQVSGLLIDLDGVLFVGEQAIPGAVEALRKINALGIKKRFITNTSTKTQQEVQEKLLGLGFEVSESEIFTPLSATVQYLHTNYHQDGKLKPRIRPVVRDNLLGSFSEFEIDEINPQVIIVGDIGDLWDYPLLNSIFNQLKQGAELVSLHKNRYFLEDDGLKVDIGLFIAGLEYVTDKTAFVVGKPNKSFFNLALQSLGLKGYDVAMIGDDMDSDILGAKQSDITGVLVKTGKYLKGCEYTREIQPDLVIDSFSDLIQFLPAK